MPQIHEPKPLAPPAIPTAAPIRSNEEELLAFIQNRDVPCPHCQYNVRNLARPVCPECGTRLVLQVGQEKPFLVAWSIMMLALFLPAGMGLVVAVAFTIAYIKRGFPLRFRAEEIAAFLFVATIPLALLAFIFRERILRLGRKTQIYLAVWSVLICLLVYGCLGCLAYFQ